MTDTHTHILPGVDDGAADVAQSLAMLRASRAQGVDTVVLTPHFYPNRESLNGFLSRREAAFEALQATVGPKLPRLLLGAEVAWFPGIEHMEDIHRLTIGNTPYLLLELPYQAWTQEHLDSVWALAEAGRVIPILAHVDRYLRLQKNGQFQSLLALSLPMQLSAGMFDGFFSRAKALHLLAQGQWMIGSDCHNMTNRAPCMALAKQYLQRRAPERMAALNWKFD